MSEERRLVTVLFADVVGSTSLGESMDPEDLRRLLARFYAIASEVISEHGGTLEKFIGDAAMAIFGLPHAHDDDARRALDAALALRARLRDDPALAEQLPIRIGLNTGEVIASRDPERNDFLVTGDPVNVAARLQQAAEPWQILASARTAVADGGAHDFGSVKPLELKGKAARVESRVLLGHASAGTGAPRAPLVGREADLAQIEMVARRAITERRPYMVSLLAPAGTGKSRLVDEFIDRLPGIAEDSQVAVAQCLPYGQRLTYWPMRALLESIIGLPADSAPEQTRDAIRTWLVDAGAERPAESADLLAATVGASDADVQDRAPLFLAWREIVELAATRRPLVLLVEDLHWSSDSLLDLIEFILQPRADSAILMLALARPELLERRPTWGGGRRNHISLALEPLDEESIGALIRGLLEGAAPELVPFVAARSEGNPFFAGEIVRTLLEHGVNLGDPAAVAEAASRLPDTVQATVLARLDSLAPHARRVLQLGSVFGRSFSTDGVSSIEGARDDHAAAIEELIDRDLLRPSGRGELTFRHIIIRDVAYGTLTRQERATLHAAAGRWLELRATGREDELAELVAFHFREAAVLSVGLGTANDEIRNSAVRWLSRAAEASAGARGVSEAAGHLRAAIELASGGDQAQLWGRLGEVLGSGDAAVQALARAWQLGREQGLPPRVTSRFLGRHLMIVLRFGASIGRQPTEQELEELIALGESWLPDAGKRAAATFEIALGFKSFWLRQVAQRPVTEDDTRKAQDHIQRGLAMAEELGDPQLISAALDALSGISQADDWETSVELSNRRLAFADRLSLEERLDALGVLAWGTVLLGRLDEAATAADAAVALLQPGQNLPFVLASSSWSAYVGALRGDWSRTEASLDDLWRRWLDAGRTAAAYALQGVLSGIDWARNRGADTPLERWREVSELIVTSFPPEHPVTAVAALPALDLDGMVDVIRRHERYPDRAHFVEHAIALCADRDHPVPVDVLDDVLDRSRRVGLRVLEAQALRSRGVTRRDPDDLRRALDAFEAMGAGRYGSRARLELGALTGDAELVTLGRGQMEALGEAVLLEGLLRG